MFECLVCDRQFFDFDVQTDEFGGKRAVCPFCKSDIAELIECKVCGELCSEDETSEGVCDSCIYDEYQYNAKGLMELFEDEKDTVEIGCFFTYYFSASQIEDILKGVILANEQVTKTDNSDFIECDKDYMARLILKARKNND